MSTPRETTTDTPASASMAHQPELRRGLGLGGAILLTIGSIVGTGIFLTGGDIAVALPHAGLIMFVWIAGGLLVLAGALTFAELGAAFPKAGGSYHYLKETYGPFWGFLYGWLALLVYMSGGIAAIASGFGNTLGSFLPWFSPDHIVTEVALGSGPGAFVWQLHGGSVAAVIAIVLLTGVNHFGLGFGAGVNNGLTLIKVGACAIFTAWAFSVAAIAFPDYFAPLSTARDNAAAFAAAHGIAPTSLLVGIGAAMTAVLWTYDGWFGLTASAGELRDPSRNLPRGLLAGVLIVIALYIGLNLMYFRAIPVTQMMAQDKLGEHAALALLGGPARTLFVVGVLISSFGCLASTILYSSRIYVPMAQDGLFFASVGKVHPRWRTPVASLWVQSAWAVVLALSGKYNQLYAYAIFASLLIMMATGGAVFVLRRKRPDLPRPYRVWGYPTVPLLFLVGVGFLIFTTVQSSPIESISGLGLVALGFPAYMWFKRRRVVLSRRRAALAVAVLTAVALGLRLWDLRYGLPFVFHNDFFQIEQAASLLRRGWFTDSYDYPHGLVYVYAAVAWTAHALHLSGLPRAADWGTFTERFGDPAVHQLVGRAVSAVAGALLVPAVYRLSRVRFGRGVSLLAAAAIAVDAAHVLTAHQTRPHAVVITLVIAAAASVMRVAARPGVGATPSVPDSMLGSTRHAVRRAITAGAGLGVAASIFPLGTLACGWAGLLIALNVRPLRRAAALIGGLLLGFVLVWGGLGLLMNRADVARPLPGGHALDATSTLSLPARMLGWADPGRVPRTALNWIASSPVLFAAAAAFVVACFVHRRKTADTMSTAPAAAFADPNAARREALRLYGSFPLLAFATMSLFVGSPARYALAATPFLAPLAAAACLELGPRAWRVITATLLVLLPLAGTMQYLRLLSRVDTRLSVATLLPGLTGAGATVALQDRLVVDRSRLGPNVHEFPPHEALARWDEAAFAPRQALRDSGATLFLRATGSQWSRGPLAPADLEALGFRLYGQLRGGTASTFDLPDLPDRFATQLLHATRPGPTIEFWALPEGRSVLAKLVPADRLAEWSGAESPEAAVSAVLAQRGGADGADATGSSTSTPPHSVRVDLDGDGSAEDVGSNVDAVQLAKLLALPTDAWRDLGGARAGERGAPRLSVRGRPVNGAPVLLLLTGAGAGGSVRWSVRVATESDAAGTEIPMPELAAGSGGALALAALWPKDAPAGTTVTVQAFVADAGAPQGVAASNTMTATSPR